MPPEFASLRTLFMGSGRLVGRVKGENGLNPSAGARVGGGGHHNTKYNPVFRGMVCQKPADS